MTRTVLGILAGLLCSTAAWAAMRVGDKAPDFTLQAAVGGKTFTFHLAEALKKGPVVLYFYPKSFTAGCTIEAHEFAENAENFAATGASLIGVSADGIETQIAFSSKECRDKFPVGADADGKVIRAYDAQMFKLGAIAPSMSNRISYVIAPHGRILYAYQDSEPQKHIANTLAAVQQWRKDHRP
ncbi:peroxiredoxin [Rhodoblastus acidophilus]|uniref:thioredoxin-dependent peroxiredoxin n=1 Tax=Candidatus Rhodoblastus alkanivorans TaxID=2954117 RepID=A0ABS9ZAF6_9HYPH|nr:peroxiredoxin [Candidatus Rhodoblastus alkanivorans]MCI4678359.1 peroxiredoxin [Candidatus Rhodoblastus alkanivorans]MCI4683617.1 peroxiredoxin [Candidatus Rhodoblastus alkanivorans]MDI4640933.1 peroxiredoxin [Rhodoblastus acidophilus]